MREADNAAIKGSSPFPPTSPPPPQTHLVINVALCEDVAQHAHVEVGLAHVVAPVLLQGRVRLAQVVPRDLAAHVVGHVHADVVRQELNPVGGAGVKDGEGLGWGGQ